MHPTPLNHNHNHNDHRDKEEAAPAADDDVVDVTAKAEVVN